MGPQVVLRASAQLEKLQSERVQAFDPEALVEGFDVDNDLRLVPPTFTRPRPENGFTYFPKLSIK